MSTLADPTRIERALAELPALHTRDRPEGTAHYLAATPDTVSWGWLPSGRDAPVLEVVSGDLVCVDTVSHEGVLADQGRDPRRFFGRFGVPADSVLDDAATIAASPLGNDPLLDGPHLVTGPIAVAGARPGDVLSISVLALEPRVPYGIVSSRHGKGALPGEVLDDGEVFSAF
jgi:acetamidase/formamidase